MLVCSLQVVIRSLADFINQADGKGDPKENNLRVVSIWGLLLDCLRAIIILL